jgi:tetratricopeptide (TPR) repeat protein
VRALREAQRLDPHDAAPAFAEAAVRCERRPGEPFDANLRARLARAGMEPPRSATARMHYVLMARFCGRSGINDEVLLPLYERHRRSADENIAVASLFGAGAAYLRMGRIDEANAAWQKAIGGYPQGAAIRTWVRALLAAD